MEQPRGRSPEPGGRRWRTLDIIVAVAGILIPATVYLALVKSGVWWLISGGIGACVALPYAFIAYRRWRPARDRSITIHVEIPEDISGVALEEMVAARRVLFWAARDIDTRWDRAVERAAREAVSRGLVVFNIPAKMVQGKKERVEVKIARSAAFREQMLSELRGKGEPQVEEIDTSIHMRVELVGPSFEVVSFSPEEQLVIPDPATWEFNVTPLRYGQRQITLSVEMRIEAKGIVGGRRGVSVLEKQIDVQVNIGYATRTFVSSNWQWLAGTGVAIVGVVAAWLVVPF